MTLAELIEQLEDLAYSYGDDVEVRLAQQPNWPFEYSIDSIIEGPEDGPEDAPVTTIYIVEGQQLGYLPNKAAAIIGWAEEEEDEELWLEEEE